MTGNVPRRTAEDYLSDSPSAGLRRQVARGTLITLAGQWAGLVVQLASTVLLARLLNASDYGVVAGVVAITGFAEMLKDLGLGGATVQNRHITAAQVNTLFWINTVLGAVFMIVVAASAPLVASFYGDADAAPVTVALALPFLLGGLSVQHTALLNRALEFRLLTTTELSSRVVGLGFAVVLGLAGAGYWALVANTLSGTVVRTVLLWRACSWRPGQPAWASGIRPMLSFGGYLSGFNILNYASRNADNIFIGWYWGTGTLGLYSRAYQLLLLPLQQINTPLSRVAVPALSQLQDQKERYRRYYQTALSAIALVAAPLVVLMAVTAEEIVAIMLGPRWHAAGPIFQVLAFAGITQTVSYANGWLYQTTGRARRQFYWALISRSITIGVFAATVHLGVYRLAVAYAVVNTALLFPGLAWATRGSPVSMGDVGRAVWRPALIVAVMGLAAGVVHRRVDDWPDLLAGGACVLTGAAAYAACLAVWPAARAQWWTVASIVREAGGRGHPRAADSAAAEPRGGAATVADAREEELVDALVDDRIAANQEALQAQATTAMSADSVGVPLEPLKPASPEPKRVHGSLSPAAERAPGVASTSGGRRSNRFGRRGGRQSRS